MIVTSVQIKTAKTQKHLYCLVFTKRFSLCYMAEGKSFIQLFPSVMGSCFPPTGVKTRKLGFDSDCRGFFGCSNFLGICSKTSRNRSCLQRKLLLRGLVGMLARPLSQFCEHGLRHQRLHHIKLQKRSYTHPQMCRTNIL